MHTKVDLDRDDIEVKSVINLVLVKKMLKYATDVTSMKVGFRISNQYLFRLK